MNERYILDFRIMPELLEQIGDDYVRRCREMKEEFVCLLFNRFLSGLRDDTAPDYPVSQFRVTEHPVSGDTKLLYIELPDAPEGTPVWCIAYAIAFDDISGSIRNVRFHTVERSRLGTGCIGAMCSDGHLNYGKAYATAEENIRAIRDLLGA